MELCNAVWSHAKLQLRFNSDFLQRCATECVSRIQAGDVISEQFVSNLTWSFGRLGVVNEDLCRVSCCLCSAL